MSKTSKMSAEAIALRDIKMIERRCNSLQLLIRFYNRFDYFPHPPNRFDYNVEKMKEFYKLMKKSVTQKHDYIMDKYGDEEWLQRCLNPKKMKPLEVCID